MEFAVEFVLTELFLEIYYSRKVLRLLRLCPPIFKSFLYVGIVTSIIFFVFQRIKIEPLK